MPGTSKTPGEETEPVTANQSAESDGARDGGNARRRLYEEWLVGEIRQALREELRQQLVQHALRAADRMLEGLRPKLQGVVEAEVRSLVPGALGSLMREAAVVEQPQGALLLQRPKAQSDEPLVAFGAPAPAEQFMRPLPEDVALASEGALVSPPPRGALYGGSPTRGHAAAGVLHSHGTPQKQGAARGVRLRLPEGAVPRGSEPCLVRAMSKTPTRRSDSIVSIREVDDAERSWMGSPYGSAGKAESPYTPYLRRCDSRKSMKSEYRSQEDMKWKQDWKGWMKSRLSQRLNTDDFAATPQTNRSGMQKIKRKLKLAQESQWETTSRPKPPRGYLEAFMDSVWVQVVCAVIIMTNAVFIGIQTDISTRNAAIDPGLPDPAWFEPFNTAFVALFVTEVLMRMLAKRTRFFFGYEWQWNLFDVVSVVLTLLEETEHLTSTEWDLTYTRLLRGFRMVRMLRVIRVLRFFRELRLMVCSILQSLVSLSWALVLLFSIMYLFSICFMHGVDHYLRRVAVGSSPDKVREQLAEWYGSVPTTMYTLLLAISGGVDWLNVEEPLGEISYLYKVLFAFYVLFVIIGVLNVLTSVFVQRAKELVSLDRDLVVQCQLVSNETFVAEMKSIFEEVDVDQTGTITWDKFREYIQNEHVQAYFATHQLDTSDARELFNLLDEDGKAEVKIEDFIMGCMKLRGQAKSSDVATLMRESKRTGRKTMRAMAKIDRQLAEICSGLALPPMVAEYNQSWMGSVMSPSSRFGSPTPTSTSKRSPRSHFP